MHNDVLKLLFPVEIIGVFDGDIALEGQHLDLAQTSAEALLADTSPASTSDLIAGWERVYGLTPAIEATLQDRRDAVLRKIRERGGLSREYFIALAAAYGHTITIDELLPFMAGWNGAGDLIYIEDIQWVWQVNAPVGAESLEAFFDELKPAYTGVCFNYTEA